MTHMPFLSTDSTTWGAVISTLTAMTHRLTEGRDETVAAVKRHADAIGARLLLAGGAAVIVNGYLRTTDDRDFLVDYRQVRALADRLTDDPDWERLEIRQYAFIYRPTGVLVDFLVQGDLIHLGRPYLFPDPASVEVAGQVEAVDVIGLHDLMFLKLLAGRMKDLADVMELCKANLHHVDADKVVGRLQPEDDDLRQQFLQILRQAPAELAAERQFGKRDENSGDPS